MSEQSGSNDLHYLEPLVNFIGEMLGPMAEIVLYDVKARRVQYVKNPFDSEMVAGSKMRPLEQSFLDHQSYESEDYIVNYRALSHMKEKLKSATYFLKNAAGELLAILTINQRVEQLIALRDTLEQMISGFPSTGGKPSQNFYESFEVSVPELVSKAISDELHTFSVPPDRLDAGEKMRLIQSLDAKGIFLVKGAIGELAKTLDTTETTVYRYISRLSEE